MFSPANTNIMRFKVYTRPRACPPSCSLACRAGWLVGWSDARMHGRMDGQTNEWTDGGTDAFLVPACPTPTGSLVSRGTCVAYGSREKSHDHVNGIGE